MINNDQKRQLSEILGATGKTLGITKAQYEAAVASYQFVGDWLCRPGSPLAPFHPEILPQGSFLLGTMNQPVHTDDDMDVDLVCRIDGKLPWWAQVDLKNAVGDWLKAHGTLKKMLDKEGRRCWTLLYRESVRFHMDILPAIVANNFKVLLEKAMSESDTSKIAELAIRITDRHLSNYRTVVNPDFWLKSNPFGYAIWFKQRSAVTRYKIFTLNEAVQPVPAYEEDRSPLQQVVLILKRHRDIMFNGDADKPISIIITTLAALAYNGEDDIFDALNNVVSGVERFIVNRYDPVQQRTIKWIANPVNQEENFADKWVAEPQKQANFYRWLQQVKDDIASIVQRHGGLPLIKEGLSRMFGETQMNEAFAAMGDQALKTRVSGGLKMAAGTGMLSEFGRTPVTHHNNFGSNE